MGVSYFPVADPGEVAPGARKPVLLGERELLLANENGEWFAFVRTCPHEGAELDASQIDGESIICEGHSYCYNLRTGECEDPAGGPALAVFPVEEHEGRMCIKLEW